MTLNSSGYVLIWKPQHPFCNWGGYCLQHRLVMEGVIGRYLDSKEHVHHIDGNPLNNKPSNLQIVTVREHHRLHHGWSYEDGRWFKRCPSCDRKLEVNESNFYMQRRRPGTFRSVCIPCKLTEGRKEYAQRQHQEAA